MSSRHSTATCRTLAAIGLALVLSGCGHEPVHRVPDEGAGPVVRAAGGRHVASSRGETAASYAIDQVGVPYRYGGSTTRGFDCSGLVQFAWSRAGRSIPRTTSAQFRSLSPVGRKDLRAGDLVFFRIDGSVSHVGLYLGNDRFVHAPSSGRTVSVARLDSGFYRGAFVRGARP